MSGYRGFPSKAEYIKYYSGPLPQWELDAMEAYTKEAEQERENFKMSDPTKACNLTEAEIKILINSHGYSQDMSIDDRIERMNYLNKRLKAFTEIDEKSLMTKSIAETSEEKPAAEAQPVTQKAW